MDAENIRFMLDSIKILLECGETAHAIALIDAYSMELERTEKEKTEAAD